MKKGVKWLFILTPVVVLAFIIMNMLVAHGGGYTANQMSGMHGARGGGHFNGGGFHEERSMYVGVFILPFLFGLMAKLAFLLAGVMIWLRAKSNGWKVAGGIMVGLGVLAVLPAFIAWPLILIVAYYLYKSSNTNRPVQVEELVTVQDLTVPSYQHRDLLDEWEDKIRREEK